MATKPGEMLPSSNIWGRTMMCFRKGGVDERGPCFSFQTQIVTQFMYVYSK